MFSFKSNKFFAAFLANLFILFSISILFDLIFASPQPKTAGSQISKYVRQEEKKSSVFESAIPFLAQANVEAGKFMHRKCLACHSVEKNGPNKVGPNLWNILNRPVSSFPGFSYSVAMKNFSSKGKMVWNYENLDHFLASPKNYIKGTLMVFSGIPKASERANLIAYLRTLSSELAPLPEKKASRTPVLPKQNFDFEKKKIP